MVVLTCSGLSSNAGKAVSARGGAVVVVVVDLVVDVLAPWLPPLLHPAVRMQMPATASAAVSWRTSSPPLPRCNHQPISTGAIPLQRCRLKLGCDERIFARGGSDTRGIAGFTATASAVKATPKACRPVTTARSTAISDHPTEPEKPGSSRRARQFPGRYRCHRGRSRLEKDPLFMPVSRPRHGNFGVAASGSRRGRLGRPPGSFR